jgi:flagellar biosynthesis/type III secretory pathway M-ring protein FliF/YscJ
VAEEIKPAPSGGGRQILILATVAMVVFFAIFLVGLRSCSSSNSNPASSEQQQKQTKVVSEKPAGSNVAIYSNLDLKDASSVVVRLKDLKIPYQLLDGGRTIAVPKARADEARLGLAEKNLPTGGTIGWEIFDQSKLGATDSDRRIQFIRAISGELSRAIDRISAVQDARVLLVIPETNMFAATTSPVTASVLLKLNPGMTLSQEQVNAIVYLVAGSVENLKPQNITIIDTDGNILTGGGIPLPTPKIRANVVTTPAIQPVTQQQENQELIVEKAQEKEALQVQAKIDLEEKLTSKAQAILNRIYPPNTVMVKVSVDSIKDMRTTVVVLLDKRFNLTNDIKSTTIDTLSAAVGYDAARGDKILIKRTTFRTVTQGSATVSSVNKLSSIDLSQVKSIAKKIYRKYGRVGASAVIIIPVIILLLLFRMLFSPKRPARVVSPTPREETTSVQSEEGVPTEESAQNEEIPVVEEMRTLASQSPDQAANLIRQWIMEDNG